VIILVMDDDVWLDSGTMISCCYG